jgi:hypothetical protein
MDRDPECAPRRWPLHHARLPNGAVREPAHRAQLPAVFAVSRPACGTAAGVMPRTHPLLVVQTWFRPDGRFDVELASDDDAQTRLRFVTRDQALYNEALQIEGHAIRIAADWHWAGTDRILDAIHPAPPEDE